MGAAALQGEVDALRPRQSEALRPFGVGSLPEGQHLVQGCESSHLWEVRDRKQRIADNLIVPYLLHRNMYLLRRIIVSERGKRLR
jgi:hypothetical protein